jgi:hypothetical protein
MAVPWALAMLPVQGKRHVRLLSNVQPENAAMSLAGPWPSTFALQRSRELSVLASAPQDQPGHSLDR